MTTNYVYDGQTVVGEVRSDGTSSWYTPGPSGYISRTDLDSAGNVTNKEWFVYDGLGSCRALVKPNAQGTEAVLVARYDYDVYGAVRTQSGSSANQFKYVAGIGHPTDEETGLIYMRARYYEPGVGRFVSEDPGRNGGNWFWYANGNPSNLYDPDGEQSRVVNVAAAIWALISMLGAAPYAWKILKAVATGASAVIRAALLGLAEVHGMPATGSTVGAWLAYNLSILFAATALIATVVGIATVYGLGIYMTYYLLFEADNPGREDS